MLDETNNAFNWIITFDDKFSEQAIWAQLRWG